MATNHQKVANKTIVVNQVWGNSKKKTMKSMTRELTRLASFISTKGVNRVK